VWIATKARSGRAFLFWERAYSRTYPCTKRSPPTAASVDIKSKTLTHGKLDVGRDAAAFVYRPNKPCGLAICHQQAAEDILNSSLDTHTPLLCPSGKVNCSHSTKPQRQQ
jgi:hypothetical protein